MGRSSFPPGFRFHPTDVELVLYYLKRKIMGKVLRFEFIEELDLYKFAPWDLPDKSCLKSNDLEWYFFCPRDKKYACGARMNRATEIGYWKTTGRDRDVSCNLRTVGMKKTLVFHVGRAPRGDRTNWVMHEYRLQDKDLVEACISQDAYVLCKIFEKGGSGPRNGEQHLAPFREEDWEDEDDSVTCIAVKSSEVACPSSPLVLPSSDNNVSMEKTMFVGESICCSSPQKIPCEILLANTREESPPSMLTREESPLSMLVGGSIYCSSLKTMPCQTLQANTRDETLPLPQEDDIEKLMELFGDEDCGNVTNEAYTREEYPPVLQEDNIEKLMQVFGDEDCGNYNYEMPHSYNPGNTVETSLPMYGVDIYSNLEDLNNCTSQVPIDNFLLPNSLGESLSRDHMLPTGDNAFFLELDDLARPMKYPMEAYRSEFVHNDLLDSLQTYESTIGIRDSFNPSPTLEDNHMNQTATSWGYGGDMENSIIPSDGKAKETDIDMWFNGLGKR